MGSSPSLLRLPLAPSFLTEARRLDRLVIVYPILLPFALGGGRAEHCGLVEDSETTSCTVHHKYVTYGATKYSAIEKLLFCSATSL